MRSKLGTSLLLVATLFSLPQCIRMTEGIEVDVAYRPAATPAQIRTDMGYRVKLERALMVVGRVELVRCDTFVRDLTSLFTPARARAHVLETPTSLGEPWVIDLLESGGIPLFAGTLRPPPGDYCSLRLTGMPADDDAIGLTDENLEMMHHSILVSGSVVDTTTDEETPLTGRIWEVLQWEVPLERPLELGSPGLESVAVEIDTTCWFDGIDFAGMDFGPRGPEDAILQQLTDNVKTSLRAVLPDLESAL